MGTRSAARSIRFGCSPGIFVEGGTRESVERTRSLRALLTTAFARSKPGAPAGHSLRSRSGALVAVRRAPSMFGAPARSFPLSMSGALVAAVLALSMPGGLVAQAVATGERGATGQDAPRVADFVPDVLRGYDLSLSIREMMRGPELVGEGPVGVSWTDDSRWIYFRWRPGGGEWSDERNLYRVPAEGGEPERLSEEAADTLAVLFAPGALSSDRRFRVSAVEGDLHLVDRSSLAVRPLTRLAASASSPSFSDDDRRVFFLHAGNLFSVHLDDGAVIQLTDLRTGRAPGDPSEPEGLDAFLRDQQLELFEHVRTREARRAREDEARERRDARGIPVRYLGPETRVTAIEPDPTGRYALVLTQRPTSATPTVIPDWVTESGYTDPMDARSKVGDEQSVPRAAVLELATGEMRWLDPVAGSVGPPAGRPRDGTRETSEADPAADQERTRSNSGEEAPGLATVASRGWSDDGSRLLLFSVTDDFKYRRIHALDPVAGTLTLLDELHDPAWVAGPCFNCAGFLPGGTRAYFVSEATGFSQLYAVNADGSNRAALTSGEWEVHSVEIPEDRSHFLLRTNEGSPFHQAPWRMAFDGSDRRRLLDGEGRFEATPSPDGARLAVVHSRPTRPPELFVAPNEIGAGLEQITVSPIPEWLAFPWVHPEIIEFTADDGVEVPARIYRPADLGVEANGAAVVFVHGAGYLQNVHHWWSTYYREYMFHHFLAAQGYTVLDIDYRGSAGYGRDWRTAIYRWMGGNDLSDHVDGVSWLVANEGVDPARIGIYGGSYGGFITLMALFTEPDVFHAGAALRSVTDWAHYNHGYTARILNQPQDDPEAYRRSSPIYFAEGFRGHLLIPAPMVDTNVHFQDGVRLVQRLIELGKENWEIALYPVENHGFVEPSSWTDEYRRIYELFERTLR